MTAIADISDLINLATGGGSANPQNLVFFKDSRVGAAAAAATVAGRMTSLWQYDGQPSDGAAPTTVAAPTASTTGGLRQTDPGGGRQLWCTGGVATAGQAGTLILYDRILHIGGLSGTVTTAQAVAGSTTRYTNGIGVQIWVEIYTQIGASGTTITASYTNDAAASGQTTQATSIGNTGLREAQRMIQLPLASGDKGVEAVASVTLAGTTGTAGNFGVTLAVPILYIPIGFTSVGGRRNLIAGLPGIQEVKTGACLAWMFLPNGTTAPQLWGNVQLIEK